MYVGNLQYHVSEQMVRAYFGAVGVMEQMVFGVNAQDHKQKIGFVFLRYASHRQACLAVDCLDGTELLDKTVHVQLDPGFQEGRQFGRGKSGHQRYKEKERKLSSENVPGTCCVCDWLWIDDESD